MSLFFSFAVRITSHHFCKLKDWNYEYVLMGELSLEFMGDK